MNASEFLNKYKHNPEFIRRISELVVEYKREEAYSVNESGLDAQAAFLTAWVEFDDLGSDLDAEGMEWNPKRVVCAKCGSDRIQVVSWVDGNINDVFDNYGDGDPDYSYCADCDAHTGTCMKEDFDGEKE